MTSLLLAEAVLGAPVLGAVGTAVSPPRLTARVATLSGVVTAGLALGLAAVAVAHPAGFPGGRWITVDGPAALLAGVIGVIGAVSLVVSPAYLRTSSAAVVRATGPSTHRSGPDSGHHSGHRDRLYYSVLLLFLAVLLAVPMAGNLAEAWLLIEATTAFSALLVGFSGKRRALEAGWKYLILTSLGLGIALLGIALLAGGMPGHGLSGLTWPALQGYRAGHQQATVAYVLVLVGLAAKAGWAPVHNWLPDAHSEAPPPVSALLSAALLPAVILVAWRVEHSLTPVLGARTASRVLIAFGLLSLLVAVPFLWRRLPWKRLLAYSSLEHMGVVALGIGFGTPLALAGVAVHIIGHAIAKALGFYAATPLLAHEPRAGRHPTSGIGRSSPGLGAAMGVSLGALSGLPPSPLFASEVLILAGGFRSGHVAAAMVAALLLALGFLGLAHAFLDAVAGTSRRSASPAPPGLPAVVGLCSVSVVLLLLLTAGAFALPGTALMHTLWPGST